MRRDRPWSWPVPPGRATTPTETGTGTDFCTGTRGSHFGRDDSANGHGHGPRDDRRDGPHDGPDDGHRDGPGGECGGKRRGKGGDKCRNQYSVERRASLRDSSRPSGSRALPGSGQRDSQAFGRCCHQQTLPGRLECVQPRTFAGHGTRFRFSDYRRRHDGSCKFTPRSRHPVQGSAS